MQGMTDAEYKVLAERLLEVVAPSEDTKFYARQTEWSLVVTMQIEEAASQGVQLPLDLELELRNRFPKYMNRIDEAVQARNLHLVAA